MTGITTLAAPTVEVYFSTIRNSRYTVRAATSVVRMSVQRRRAPSKSTSLVLTRSATTASGLSGVEITSAHTYNMHASASSAELCPRIALWRRTPHTRSLNTPATLYIALAAVAPISRFIQRRYFNTSKKLPTTSSLLRCHTPQFDMFVIYKTNMNNMLLFNIVKMSLQQGISQVIKQTNLFVHKSLTKKEDQGRVLIDFSIK